MHWLLGPDQQAEIRATMTSLVETLSTITTRVQEDQSFTYPGRKDRRKASTIVNALTRPGDLVVDPFSGSGTFPYAAVASGREVAAAEWEPYAHRLSSAPWRSVPSTDIISALAALDVAVGDKLRELYSIVCDCGNPHVLETQWFDREPLRYSNVTTHERLGTEGRTIVYRGASKCRACGATEKYFDERDQAHLNDINGRELPLRFAELFATRLIPNSRINISGDMTIYGNLFPVRSRHALSILWQGIEELDLPTLVHEALVDTFLSIVQLAKFKDYRSKSQDLHPPRVMLRESNVYLAFISKALNRTTRLAEYGFAGDPPIRCVDFRSLLAELEEASVDLVLTDPPWNDGYAYFERGQLYHPWLNYRLADDPPRLEGEVIVTDAPSRSEHDNTRWWQDIEEFFAASSRVVKDLGYLALFFRPIPATRWLDNLNRLKFAARKAGFEPLLSVDVTTDDPAMRVQQSASYVFVADVVFVFVKLPRDAQRAFIGNVDLDHLAYRAAEALQERLRKPFTFREWQEEFARTATDAGAARVNTPQFDIERRKLFERYTSSVPQDPGVFLPEPNSPFAGQLFDIPATERLFAYVPHVIRDLTIHSDRFTYEMFLLRLGEFVENGTRQLIDDVQDVRIRELLDPYATPVAGDPRLFERRPTPTLPRGITEVMALDPYSFENFCAVLLEKQGYTDVAIRGRSGDRGVDISAVDPQGKSVVIQCKRYLGNVSAEPIQRLHSFSVTRNAHRRIVITTSGFTPDARDEAANTDTELIDGRELERLVATFFPEFIETPEVE